MKDTPLKTPSGVKALLHSPRLPFLLLWAFLAVCHLFFIMGGGDDYAHGLILGRQSLWSFTVQNYGSWSSRSLTDIPVLVFTYLPYIVWQLLNPVVITCLGWALAGLGGVRQNASACWLVCGLLVLYPWQVMDSAGWVTTSCVFVWTGTAGAAALYQLKRVVTGERVHPALQVLAVLGVLYAANMEQVLIVLLPLLACLCVYLCLQKRRVPTVLWAALAAAAADLVYVLACPGNRYRLEGETVSWYPNFGMKGLFSKVELGASAALSEVFYAASPLFFFFLLLLAWAVFLRRRELLFRLASLVPLVVCGVFGLWGAQLAPLVPGVRFFTEALTGEGMITLANVNTLTAFLPLAVLYGSLFLCLVCLYLALGHTANTLAALAVFGFGLVSRLAIGFSPTIWTSGPRTSFFWQMSTVAVAVLLYRELAPLAKRWQKIVFWCLFGLYCAVGLYAIQELRIASGY